MRIDLVGLPGSARVWTHGRQIGVQPEPQSVKVALDELLKRPAEFVLFWLCRTPYPSDDVLKGLLSAPGDVWHAGLLHGVAGQPGMLDHVSPNWMFNADPPPQTIATSWRVSFHACLARSSVLDTVGLPDAEFKTLAAASLEWGHRCISQGVRVRSAPALGGCPGPFEVLPFEDELRFLLCRYGRRWTTYAALRAWMTGRRRFWDAARELRRVRRALVPREGTVFRPPSRAVAERPSTVAVVIPTLYRYPFLRVVLDQLRLQTLLPSEVVVIDQTPAGQRDHGLLRDFGDLPLRILYLDSPGQCASRNAGIIETHSEFLLFVDDDDELEPTLIAQHLDRMLAYGADSVSGVAHELETGPPPNHEAGLLRASDVFPTNNTLARRELLRRSGLFDLAYNRHPRADGDLGMRAYLAGALMLLDTGNRVLHHRAQMGGLRAHGARVVTARTSREQLTHRHLPAISEIYLLHRYFTPRQRRETLYIRALTTLVGRGPGYRRLLKALLGLLLMPHTVYEINRRAAEAKRWLTKYPSIPWLP